VGVTMSEDKKEIKIEVPKDIAEKIEKITNFLNSLKEKKEAVSKEKVEEMLKLLDEVKDKLPKVNVDFEKIAKALEGTGSEVKIVFNKLTIDGEVGLKIIPVKKDKKD
jgi:DNA-directed RNA polymerase subunit H (RpoH/RPB5)